MEPELSCHAVVTKFKDSFEALMILHFPTPIVIPVLFHLRKMNHLLEPSLSCHAVVTKLKDSFGALMISLFTATASRNAKTCGLSPILFFVGTGVIFILLTIHLVLVTPVQFELRCMSQLLVPSLSRQAVLTKFKDSFGALMILLFTAPGLRSAKS